MAKRKKFLWSWDDRNSSWLCTSEDATESDVIRRYSSARKHGLDGAAFVLLPADEVPREHPETIGIEQVWMPAEEHGRKAAIETVTATQEPENDLRALILAELVQDDTRTALDRARRVQRLRGGIDGALDAMEDLRTDAAGTSFESAVKRITETITLALAQGMNLDVPRG